MTVLAFDLGASSGKLLSGTFKGGKLTVAEVHRFPNDPVQVGSHLYWDVLRLFHEMKQGLLKAKWEGIQIEAIGIDTWAVDYGLLGKDGQLLANPHHYRDERTTGMQHKVHALIPDDELFTITGLQQLPFNTIYQLAAEQVSLAERLIRAETLLLMPDLFRYFFTGERTSELTVASTTQLFNAHNKDWDQDLIRRLNINSELFTEIVQPASRAGHLLPSLSKALSLPRIPFIAVGEHDTASAVAAVPATEGDFAYLSSGTWSLLGTEVAAPVMTPRAKALNFTNEGGVQQSFRLLKNIMGLWLLQRCKKDWENEGVSLSYEQLNEAVQEAQPFRCYIDPDDAMFLNPAHMPQQIQYYCKRTNQDVPRDVGAIVRCIVESLALKYRLVLEQTEELSGKSFKGLHIVGGGVNNVLLCQFTANAIGREVWAGPIEASAIGNMAAQFIALGLFKDIAEARQVIKASFPIKTYEPVHAEQWEAAYVEFCERCIANG